MDQTAKHVIFRGRVQGVGFRYTTHDIAGRYEVTGFVRNLHDGTVELFLQGDPAQVDNCIRDIQDAFAGYIQEARIEPAPCNPRTTSFRIAF